MNEEQALKVFGHAATVTQWAAAATNDVSYLDSILAIGSDLLLAASLDSALLFPMSMDLIDAMTFVAWCHLERFDYRLDLLDLDEAERYTVDALKLAVDTNLSESINIRAQTVVARARFCRFDLNGDRSVLDDAVAGLESVTELQLDPIAMAALATCLRRRAEISQPEVAIDDLNKAAELLITLADSDTGPPEITIYPLLLAEWLSELGLVHLTASRLFGEAEKQEQAQRLVSEATDIWPNSPAVLLAFAKVEPSEASYAKVLQLTKTKARIALEASRLLTDLALDSGVPERIIRPASYTWELLQQVINEQVTETNKTVWLPTLAEITATVVPALAATGQAGSAVKCADEVRTRVLQENFPDEERELFELGMAGHQQLSAPIRHALDVLRNEQRPGPSRARARNELSRYEGMVRQIPGFETFRTNPGIDQLTANIETPLLYLVPGKPSGVALLIRPDDRRPIAITLPECLAAPPPIVQRFRNAAFSDQIPPGARRRAVNLVSDWAWASIYEPLREALHGYSSVHIIGTSYLGLVPCHSARTPAGKGWRYSSEEIEFRYVPSARALDVARRRQLPKQQVKLLVIPQPAGSGPDLDGARLEVNAVSSYFDSVDLLSEDQINSYGIRRAIGGVGWLHAACHGLTDPQDPASSGLLLADGARFTLRDLFNSNQGHLLVAVLSACQTNVPDLRLPDESTSIATGLLIGGCRAVIASAWQVPDAATSALMRMFYSEWQREGYDVSSALRRAQLAFATGDVAAPPGEWRSEWAEPYFWAGFSYLGP